jgi:hypothetical protein
MRSFNSLRHDLATGEAIIQNALVGKSDFTIADRARNPLVSAGFRFEGPPLARPQKSK